MRWLYIVIFTIFLCSFANCEELLQDEILLNNETCKLNEFCSKYINDVDIKEFIKKEMDNDYVIISLDECLDIAIKNNFDIKINNFNYLSSKYNYENALTKFLPILSVNSYISDYRGQILVGGVLQDNLHETAISVSLEAYHDLTQGGKQIFEAKADKYFAKSNKNKLNYTINQTVFFTSKYYYQTLKAKINIEIYLRNLIERNSQLEMAIKLKKSDNSHFNYIRSKNETYEAKLLLINALNEFRINQARLANVMGIDLKTALMPYEDNVKALNLVDENIKEDELFLKAIENRQDLKQYKNLIKYNIETKNSYITDFIPKANVIFQERFQGTIDNSIKPNYQLGLYINWIPGENTVLGTITKIKSQNMEIRKNELELENRLRKIKENIISSYFTSRFNKKEIIVAKNRIEYANESIKLAMERYNKNNGILIDVIEAQDHLTTAREQYLSSIISYNISQLELLYETGIIDINDIKNKYRS